MKKIYMLGLAASLCLPLAAQTPRNGYFSENLPMRHNLNPAFAPEYDYVAIPAIGGISAGMNSNVGADNFLFKKNGEVVTGLHSSVGNDEFLRLEEPELYGSELRRQCGVVGFQGSWRFQHHRHQREVGHVGSVAL